MSVQNSQKNRNYLYIKGPLKIANEKNRMDEEQIVINNIKLLMKNKGYSLRKLATLCDSNASNLSRMFNGSLTPSLELIFKISEALEADLKNEIFKGVGKYEQKKSSSESLEIGIMSISNSRITCLIDNGDVVAYSILSGGLDLADTPEVIIKLINESIKQAISKNNKKYNLSESRLNLVTQSYEFINKRKKFIELAYQHFRQVTLLPDWIITLLAAFKNNDGISLVTDKGISLAYMYENQLKKIGGWKFPVYDIGGENWLGVETIRHTIRAAEGYIPMTGLAQTVLSKFNGKIEIITECCFQSGNPDIYCLFGELLLGCYSRGDKDAEKIIKSGYAHIKETIDLADRLIGKKLKITLNGSLAHIYQPFIEKTRLIKKIEDKEKVKLLAEITEKSLSQYDIID